MYQKTMAGLQAALVLLAASSARAQVGGCCHCFGCDVVTEEECVALGGDYVGDATVCPMECINVVSIPEDALREAIEIALGGCVPTEHNMLALTDLTVFGQGITDLTGLEYAQNLTNLFLWLNDISDLSPLAGLTNLTDLMLAENQISDISPLAGLSNLTTLWLYSNQINNISPLSGPANLDSIRLENNQITDVSPLTGLTNPSHPWAG
jgi:hypothetical protein